MSLVFKPINFESHFSLAMQFCLDSHKISFGHDKYFWGEDNRGEQHYRDWLIKRLGMPRPMAFHAWLNQKIVGQVELSHFKNDLTIGYINIFYLIPSVRHQGVGQQLDVFATNYFREEKIKLLRLSVSPSNTIAIHFYEKNGWLNLGPRFSEQELNEKKCAQVYLMEKKI